GCNCKDDVDEFLLCVGQLDAVQGEKDQYYMSADTFVAVHKGMVANQPEPKLCRLSLHRRVQALPTKRLKRCSQRGLQQPIITDACRTANLLQQLLMEQEDLPFCQLFHLANTSYASLFLVMRRFEIVRTSSSLACCSLSSWLNSRSE